MAPQEQQQKPPPPKEESAPHSLSYIEVHCTPVTRAPNIQTIV